MPYIKQERRPDHLIDNLAGAIDNVGDLNYAITRLSLSLLIQQGLTYENVSNIIGTLHAVPNEMYRRFIARYEDKKASENGDVLEYSKLDLMLKDKEQ